VTWRWVAWLEKFPLNRNTVLDYFKFSDFYDRTCNNELIIQQNVDPAKIKTLTGIEYELDADIAKDDSYYLLRKQHRDSPRSVRVLSWYYVVNDEQPGGTGPLRGTVFPLPDLHAVLRMNLTTSMFYVNSAFKELSEAAKYNPARPYTWDFPDHKPTISQPQRNIYSNLVDDVLFKSMKF